jgi:hypothetical protein
LSGAECSASIAGIEEAAERRMTSAHHAGGVGQDGSTKSAVQPTETIVIVPVVPIDEVYGAVKPAVGGSGILPWMSRVKL